MLSAKELINLIEERVGYPVSDTLEGEDISAETRKLVNLLNHVLRTLQGLNDWPLLKKDGNITTKAVSLYSAGGSAYALFAPNSKTLSTTTSFFTNDMLGAAVMITNLDTNYIYTISEIISDRSVKVLEPLLGTPSIATHGLVVAQDTYALPADFDRPIENWKTFFGGNELTLLDDYAFMELRRRENTISPSEPRYFMIDTTDDDTGTQIVRLHPYPEDVRMYKFRYMRNHPPITTDHAVLLYPERQIDIIVQTMISVIDRDFEDDVRMTQTLQDALTATNRAVASKSAADRPFVLKPSQAHRTREHNRWGAGGRSFDYGTSFDVTGFRTK